MASSIFVGLYDKDATKSLNDSGNTYAWKWTLPTNINPRRAPTMIVSLASAYADDSTGAEAGQCHFLRVKSFAENYVVNEVNPSSFGHWTIYPIMSLFVRDAGAGHWYSPQSPHEVELVMSSNTKTLEFDMLDGQGNIIATEGGAVFYESLNIILKISYPEHNELRDTMVGSYVQSEIGNPPFNKLKL